MTLLTKTTCWKRDSTKQSKQGLCLRTKSRCSKLKTLLWEKKTEISSLPSLRSTKTWTRLLIMPWSSRKKFISLTRLVWIYFNSLRDFLSELIQMYGMIQTQLILQSKMISLTSSWPNSLIGIHKEFHWLAFGKERQKESTLLEQRRQLSSMKTQSSKLESVEVIFQWMNLLHNTCL